VLRPAIADRRARLKTAIIVGILVYNKEETHMRLAVPLVLFYASVSYCQQPALPPPEPEVSVFLSYRADEDPAELSAAPQAPFWKDIPGIVLDRRIDSREPAPALRTDVRSRWTDKYLYFMAVCPYENANLRPNPVTNVETHRLWEHDVLEVYIGANFEDITKYYELQVSPQGEYLDMEIDQTVPQIGIGDERLWESRWEVKSYHEPAKKIWHGEFRIPISAIDSRPVQAGNEFRINVYRLQGPHPAAPARRDFIAWQPTGEYHPHRPLKFGRLKLIGSP
jgi:hypothetical protein